MINSRGTRRRLALTVIALFAVFAVFVVRLVDIQVVRADELAGNAADHRTREATIYGTRGSIVDTNGVILADSVERFDVTASPMHVDFATTFITRDGERVEVPTSEALAELGAITGADPVELQTSLTEALATNPDSNFAYLVRAVTLDVFEQVRALGITWVYSELHPARTYPSGAVAGNLVGFLGTDEPLAGVERYMDSCLAATPGTTVYEAGADGTPLPGTVTTTEQAVDGGSVRLTIDSDLAWYVQQVLADQAGAVGAEWATGFVVRVSDGHVMAAADWPSVDPNDLNALDPEDMGARSFVSPYEPGSILKPFTFAGLVDEGLVSYDERLTVPAQYTEGLPSGWVITDAWFHGDTRWTAAGVLADSSNIGTSMLSVRQSAEDRRANLLAFGFDQKTDVGFLAEDPGRVLELSEIDAMTNVTQQFGQGMTATSAQIASAYQALGNGGVRMPLTLVEGCEYPDGRMVSAPPADPVRAVGEEAADATVKVMEQVVSQGSLSTLVRFPGYRVAAKTGTAQVAQSGRYGSERIVSVAGLVPADAPEYVVVVTIAKPDTMRTSAAAAPAFEAVVKQVIKTFRIPPSSKNSPVVALTW